MNCERWFFAALLSEDCLTALMLVPSFVNFTMHDTVKRHVSSAGGFHSVQYLVYPSKDSFLHSSLARNATCEVIMVSYVHTQEPHIGLFRRSCNGAGCKSVFLLGA